MRVVLDTNGMGIGGGAAPASPAAGNQALFIDSADHVFKLKNAASTVTAVGGGHRGRTASRPPAPTGNTKLSAWRAAPRRTA